MKIAIIGANSFLATYVISELHKEVFDLTLFGVRTIEKYSSYEFVIFSFPDSIFDYSLLLDHDAIVYTAGAGIQANLKESAELVYELNAFTPIKIINYLNENNFKGKFITFGSYFEIGNETEEKFYSEDDISIVNNPVPNNYAASKRLLTRFYNSAPLSINYYHLLLPNIYGKGENPNRLIPYLINALANNTEIKLTSGSQVRQYIHVNDVACTVKDILLNDYKQGLYNLTNEQSFSVKAIVSLVFKLTNTQLTPDENMFGKNRRTDTQMAYLLLNNKKAKETFLTQPKISIEQGIKSYYE